MGRFHFGELITLDADSTDHRLPTREKPASGLPQHPRLQIVGATESLRGGKTAATNVTSEAMTALFGP